MRLAISRGGDSSGSYRPAAKNGQDRQIFENGGGERDRTDDLLRARQTLSQLSYTPNKRV